MGRERLWFNSDHAIDAQGHKVKLTRGKCISILGYLITRYLK